MITIYRIDMTREGWERLLFSLECISPGDTINNRGLAETFDAVKIVIESGETELI